MKNANPTRIVKNVYDKIKLAITELAHLLISRDIKSLLLKIRAVSFPKMYRLPIVQNTERVRKNPFSKQLLFCILSANVGS